MPNTKTPLLASIDGIKRNQHQQAVASTAPDHHSTPAQQLLERQVTRKEFLATTALGLTSLFGLSQVIHFLTGHGTGTGSHSTKRSAPGPVATHGYGASKFGV